MGFQRPSANWFIISLATIVLLLATAACGTQTTKPVSTHAPEVTGNGSIQVLAAENFYADIALQVGGPQVTVRTILSDPNTDPHEYESSTKDAAAVSDARLLIKNGAGYDAFIDKLMAAGPRSTREVIDVSELARADKGQNPHVWYRPDVASLLAETLAEKFSGIDPQDAEVFRANARTFTSSLAPLNRKVAAMRSKYQGTPVLPTEQVSNYLLSAAGLQPAHGEFQRAIEEGTDPPARAVQEFRRQLTGRRVKLLVYNTQTTSKITEQMRQLAREQSVPVVGVSETLPKGKTFQEWMLGTLEAIETALSGRS